MRKRPIKKLSPAEQIAEYEKEIRCIEQRIINGKAKMRELQRHIRKLQTPEAEEKYRLAQKQRADRERQELRKQERHEIKRAIMERQIEECLRMNGKIQ